MGAEVDIMILIAIDAGCVFGMYGYSSCKNLLFSTVFWPLQRLRHRVFHCGIDRSNSDSCLLGRPSNTELAVSAK